MDLRHDRIGLLVLLVGAFCPAGCTTLPARSPLIEAPPPKQVRLADADSGPVVEPFEGPAPAPIGVMASKQIPDRDIIAAGGPPVSDHRPIVPGESGTAPPTPGGPGDASGVAIQPAILPAPPTSLTPPVAPTSHAPQPLSGFVFTGGPIWENPHQRPVPTAQGEILKLPPHESPVEKAIDLAKQLALSEAERKRLHALNQELEAALRQRDALVGQATQEIEQTTEELRKARAEIKKWNQDLALREQQNQAREKEHLVTLRNILASLERSLNESSTPPDADKK